MKQIEAMIACVAVTGAVLYGPVSRGLSQIETKAAPMVRAAVLQQAMPVAPPVWAMAQPPAPPAAPEIAEEIESPVHAATMCSAQARLAKDQARMQRDLARQNAELTRAANRYARQPGAIADALRRGTSPLGDAPGARAAR